MWEVTVESEDEKWEFRPLPATRIERKERKKKRLMGFAIVRPMMSSDCLAWRFAAKRERDANDLRQWHERGLTG